MSKRETATEKKKETSGREKRQRLRERQSWDQEVMKKTRERRTCRQRKTETEKLTDSLMSSRFKYNA